jgi:hypothetical protein
MALSALILKFSDLRKRSRADACATAEAQEERKTMGAARLKGLLTWSFA